MPKREGAVQASVSWHPLTWVSIFKPSILQTVEPGALALLVVLLLLLLLPLLIKEAGAQVHGVLTGAVVMETIFVGRVTHEWGKGNNTQMERITQCSPQHWDGHWAMQGPHLWEDIVGLSHTTWLGDISTLQTWRDNHLELSTRVQGYLWQQKVWNQQQWDNTVPWLCIITTSDGAKLSSDWTYISERTFFAVRASGQCSSFHKIVRTMSYGVFKAGNIPVPPRWLAWPSLSFPSF